MDYPHPIPVRRSDLVARSDEISQHSTCWGKKQTNKTTIILILTLKKELERHDLSTLQSIAGNEQTPGVTELGVVFSLIGCEWIVDKGHPDFLQVRHPFVTAGSWTLQDPVFPPKVARSSAPGDSHRTRNLPQPPQPRLTSHSKGPCFRRCESMSDSDLPPISPVNLL